MELCLSTAYSLRQLHYTFLFCKSFPLKPFLFFFRTYVIPQTFTVTFEHIRFYLLVFFVLHFLVVVSVL